MQESLENLEFNLRTVYKISVSKDMTEANFNGFLQALMNFPLNKCFLPCGCEEIEKELRRGYIEGRKLAKSYFPCKYRSIKLKFSKN